MGKIPPTGEFLRHVGESLSDGTVDEGEDVSERKVITVRLGWIFLRV